MKCRRCPQVVHGGGRGQRDWCGRERDARESQTCREILHRRFTTSLQEEGPPRGAEEDGDWVTSGKSGSKGPVLCWNNPTKTLTHFLTSSMQDHAIYSRNRSKIQDFCDLQGDFFRWILLTLRNENANYWESVSRYFRNFWHKETSPIVIVRITHSEGNSTVLVHLQSQVSQLTQRTNPAPRP